MCPSEAHSDSVAAVNGLSVWRWASVFSAAGTGAFLADVRDAALAEAAYLAEDRFSFRTMAEDRFSERTKAEERAVWLLMALDSTQPRTEAADLCAPRSLVRDMT